MPIKTRQLPSAEYLHECFEYDEDTGVLRWRERPISHFKNAHGWRIWNSQHAGNEAGHPQSRMGHLHVMINKVKYQVNRIIFKLTNGTDPLYEVDHKDTDPTNNRLRNLRSATVQQNRANKGRNSRNTSGFKGVSWYPPTGKWVAFIVVNRKSKNLGYYETPEEAAAAYAKAAMEAFGEFARVEYIER